MRRMPVSVEHEHLAKQIKSPRQGLLELVWNALDADATHVDIRLNRSTLDAVLAMELEDNGIGITAERAELSFDKLGNSWKSTQKISDAGRRFNGRHGRGRWAAFGLGTAVTWDSTAKGLRTPLEHLRISGDSNDLSSFAYDKDLEVSRSATGTTVTVTNISPTSDAYLQSGRALTDIATHFAVYIETYGVQIIVDGSPVDPQTLQTRSKSIDLVFEGLAPAPATLRVIEWRADVRRELCFVDAEGSVLHAMKPGIQAPGFRFTAYLRWGGLESSKADLVLEDLAPEPVPQIIRETKAELRKYFTEREREERSKLVDRWKEEKSYPFSGEPSNQVERAERELFDVVAITASSAIETMDQRERRLSFMLIQQALTRSPQAVHDILHDVLNLPEKELESLGALLQRTSLSAVVAMGQMIADRLDFIQALEHLVFGKEVRKGVKERSQLHKIMSKETWILKEEYALTTNDKTLTTALRDHLNLFGRDDVTVADAADREVLDTEGGRVITDMILSSVVPQTQRRRHHVVIELKRPSVPINAAGVLQANKYAVAVKNDRRFEKVRTDWEFWIVGDTISDDLVNLLDDDGVFASTGRGDNLPIRAVTWAQILDDVKHRMKFVQASLELEPDTDDGIRYLRANHADYLPDSMQDPDRDESSATEDAEEAAETPVEEGEAHLESTTSA